MKIACMIPARLQSSRFPKKMLSFLHGKPLLQWVWEAALATERFDEVVIAVDAEETADLVKSFGGKCAMTSPDCINGTERAVELIQTERLDADIVINWQGDEPLVHKAMIDDLMQSIEEKESHIWTLKKKIMDQKQVNSTQFTKVVTDHQNHALLFSRSPIPCYRDTQSDDEKVYYKHIGIYAFTKEALLKIAKIPPCSIELFEQLEMLRFLYYGLKIKVHETVYEVQGIDLPEHLALAEQLLHTLPL
jgi:3-deoxy-manno-octulosonate cytidylyltransferase (CMP-KDO synthetase)